MEAGWLGSVKRIVIVDTNTLIYIARGMISPSNIFQETGYNVLATTSKVIDELKRLSSTGKPLEMRISRTALSLIDRLGVKVIEWRGYGDADDSIESIAIELKYRGHIVFVATSDRELRNRLRLHGIPTLYYRESKGSVELEWEPP